MSLNLYEFKENFYTQNGEDGIIKKILSELKIECGFFVEFGAWDGKHWSNTYRLYKEKWKGCLIEVDKTRFKKLCENIPEDHIIKVNSAVEQTGANSLDNILKKYEIQKVDILSIDIDSDDLRIWEGITEYRPAVVVIEYNSVIPFDTRFVNPKGKMYGNGALSIYESAKRRGYTLVEGTDHNLFFIQDKYMGKTDITEKTLQEIRDQTYQLRYFFGYDGTLLHDFKMLNEAGITEFFPIPWAINFGIQPIPKVFRKVRDRINFFGLIIFFISAVFRSPIQFLTLINLSVKKLFHGRTFWGSLMLLLKKDNLVKNLKKD